MDHQPAGISFAIIGHQDSWDKVQGFVNSIRELGDMKALSLSQIKEVYKFIPPRPLFEIEVDSAKGEHRRGLYIETFISPDELDTAHLRFNIQKVKEACQYAALQNIPVVSLGGFTSIILENGNAGILQIKNTFFTTGNTLTAAFIAQGVRNACENRNIILKDSRLLIVGATGDIGSACARYFFGQVKELLLCARRLTPLLKFAEEFNNIPVKCSANADELLSEADIMICVASSMIENCNLDLLPAHAIICDAGYPKNLQGLSTNHESGIFYGGMGQAQHGYRFVPDYRNEVYHFPAQHISHGCVLEGIVLAMENKPQSYSTGRGNITAEAMDRILEYASSHGIITAPLFNEQYCWEKNSKSFLHGKEITGTGAVI